MCERRWIVDRTGAAFVAEPRSRARADPRSKAVEVECMADRTTNATCVLTTTEGGRYGT